jgi:hypothetical protein
VSQIFQIERSDEILKKIQTARFAWTVSESKEKLSPVEGVTPVSTVEPHCEHFLIEIEGLACANDENHFLFTNRLLFKQYQLFLNGVTLIESEEDGSASQRLALQNVSYSITAGKSATGSISGSVTGISVAGRDVALLAAIEFVMASGL